MRPSLFTRVLTLEALKLMSYRADFWLTSVVSFVVELFVIYVVWRAVFAETGRSEIGGFTMQSMIAYYVLVLLVGKLVRSGERDWTISTDIYEGPLTRYLLYPSPYFGYKYAEQLGKLAPALIQVAIFGAASFAILKIPVGDGVTPISIAMGIVSIAVANLLNFLFLFPIQLVAFWADNVWSLMVMLRFVVAMLGGSLLPLTLFSPQVQQILSYLPFKYLFYFPVATFTGHVSLEQWLVGTSIALGWCALMAAISRVVWRRGLLQYSGVGI